MRKCEIKEVGESHVKVVKCETRRNTYQSEPAVSQNIIDLANSAAQMGAGRSCSHEFLTLLPLTLDPGEKAATVSNENSGTLPHHRYKAR